MSIDINKQIETLKNDRCIPCSFSLFVSECYNTIEVKKYLESYEGGLNELLEQKV